MKAIAVRRGDDEPTVVELPRPDPGPGEALIRTLRVGVDGTDHEVVSGGHGGFPAGDDHLVLGHEAVGVVEDPNGTGFEAGDVVVPTVRRPPDGDDANGYFQRGEPDMAPAGEYVERGIEGAHGFMAEYITSPEEFLVPVSASQVDLGFLVEPASITEKALDLAYDARESFEWSPESALVLGNGSLGLLTLAMLRERGYDRLYCLGRRDRPDPTIDVIEKLGATYVDSRETPLDQIPEVYEPVDLAYEATGYAPHSVRSARALAPNGVTALLGVPRPTTAEVDVGAFHREFVLGNKAMVGSVNSRYEHFEAAADAVAALPEWFTDELVTGVHGIEGFERAFADDDTTIKTAVEFDAYEER